MIVPGPATRIFLAPGPTDLRRFFDGGSVGIVLQREGVMVEPGRAISFL